MELTYEGPVHSTTVKRVYFLAIAALVPFLRPTFFGDSAIFDYVNLIFMTGFWISFLLRKEHVSFPLIIPMWLIMLGSLIGMIDSQTLGDNLLALLQDVYLYLWFVTLYNVIETEADLRWATFPWAILALILGGIFLAAGAFQVLTTERALFTFKNPNMAASYFLNCFFLTFIPVLAGRYMLRIIATFIFFLCLVATGSIAALLGLVIGGMFFILSYLYIRYCREFKVVYWVIMFIAIGFMICLGSDLITKEITSPLLGEHFPEIFGRLERSIGGRLIEVSSALKTFAQDPLGIGPHGFVHIHIPVLHHAETHSDYTAYLVERGIIGFVGLIVLISILTKNLWQSAQYAQTCQDFPLTLWIAALIGAFTANWGYAIGHEILHFRFPWFMFAVIAVQTKLFKI